MAGINRTTIISGPCLVTFKGSTFFSKGDVTLKPVIDKFDVETSAMGKVDTRIKNRKYTVSFEPDGRMTSALIAVLWPYGATLLGTSIFGATVGSGTDAPLVIHGHDGIKVTMVNAALTKMPPIRLGVSVTCAGTCEFTCLLANNTAVTNSAAYLTVSTLAFPGESGWAASDILSGPALCTWGSAPWSAFTVDAPGWEITPTIKTTEIQSDGLGTVDMILSGVEVSAKATPVGPAVTDIIAAMQGSAEMGSSIAAAGTELVLTQGTSPKLITVTVYNAALVDSDMSWAAARKRVGACTWQATRTITSTTPDPLFVIGIS